nr:MAG TPA: hypothetical protein [Bacteriophage sp.]
MNISGIENFETSNGILNINFCIFNIYLLL